MPSFGANHQNKKKKRGMSDIQVRMRNGAVLKYRIASRDPYYFSSSTLRYGGYSLTFSRLTLTVYIPYICLSIKFVKQIRASSSL